MESGHASSPDVEVTSSTPAVEECVILDSQQQAASSQRKTKKRRQSSGTAAKRNQQASMTIQDDVLLLKETVNVFPYGAARLEKGKKWQEITDTLNRAIAGKEFDGRKVQDRVTRLLKSHKEAERTSLRASGTSEDYDERTQLLTDLTEMIADAKELEAFTSAEAKAKIAREEAQGKALRNAAMENLVKVTTIDSEYYIPNSSEDAERVPLSDRNSDKVQMSAPKKKSKADAWEEKISSFVVDDKVSREKETIVLQEQQALDRERLDQDRERLDHQRETDAKRLELEERRIQMEEQREISNGLERQQMLDALLSRR